MNNNVQDNTIAIFKNANRDPDSNQPEYKGTLVWNGEEINCSLWIREAKGDGKMPAGTKFFSGQLDQWKPKDKGKPKQEHYAPTGSDDDIPF